MAYSYKVYYGGDTTGPLNIPFPYIHRDHLRVTSGLIPQAYTWINDSTIQLTTPLDAGDKLVIRRKTPVDARIVDFMNGALVDEETLDLDSTQLLYCIQEILDSIVAQATGDDIDSGGEPGDVIGGTGGYLDVQEIIDTVLDNLQGEVRESHLYQTLLEKINKIDMGPISLEARLEELDNAVSGRVTVLENGIVQYDGRIQDLDIDIATLNGRIALVEDNIVQATEENVSVTDRLTMLEGDLQSIIAMDYDATTTYQKDAVVRFNGDVYRCTFDNDGLGIAGIPPTDTRFWTLASDIKNLAEDLNLRMADIERTKDALIAEDGRLHAMILDRVTIGDYTEQQAQWAGVETRMTATEDALGNVQATLTDLVQASPSDGRIAVLEQKMFAGTYNTGDVDSPADGTLMAEWSIRMDVNGNVAGVGLSLDEGGTSNFQILADRFAIVDPSGDPATKKIPFTVGKIDGVWSVGIDGNMVLDGTLAASRILVDQSIQFSTLAYDVTDKMFLTPDKKTSELSDDAALGRTADWDLVADPNGTKPENNATRNYISNGRLYGLPGFPMGVPVDNESITINYNELEGEKPPINALSIEDFGGMTLQQMIEYINDPTEAMTINGTMIDRHLIATNAIIADHLDVASLNAISANLGEVTGGRMRLLGNTYIGDLGNQKYGMSIVHPSSGWSGLYYDSVANKVEFVVNKMGSGHSLTFDTNDGKLRIDGRVISGDQVTTDANLTKRQLAVQQYVRFASAGNTYTYYHYLDRYPVYQVHWLNGKPEGAEIVIKTVTQTYIQFYAASPLYPYTVNNETFWGHNNTWGADVVLTVM